MQAFVDYKYSIDYNETMVYEFSLANEIIYQMKMQYTQTCKLCIELIRFN